MLPHTRSYWDVIVQPGRVWTQPGDDGWHRASFPFALVNSIEGETHTELYRWWYGRHGIPARRLLVESFMLLDPWRSLQTGSIPYWSVFPVEPSIEMLLGYLDGAPAFDEIDMALFCHGVESVGVASRAQLEGVLARAQATGRFAGVSPDRFPSDLSAFFRFNAFLRSLPHAHATPPRLTLDELDQFLHASAARHPAVSLASR